MWNSDDPLFNTPHALAGPLLAAPLERCISLGDRAWSGIAARPRRRLAPAPDHPLHYTVCQRGMFHATQTRASVEVQRIGILHSDTCEHVCIVAGASRRDSRPCQARGPGPVADSATCCGPDAATYDRGALREQWPSWRKHASRRSTFLRPPQGANCATPGNERRCYCEELAVSPEARVVAPQQGLWPWHGRKGLVIMSEPRPMRNRPVAVGRVIRRRREPAARACSDLSLVYLAGHFFAALLPTTRGRPD
eukprot:gene518-biopygen95